MPRRVILNVAQRPQKKKEKHTANSKADFLMQQVLLWLRLVAAVDTCF